MRVKELVRIICLLLNPYLVEHVKGQDVTIEVCWQGVYFWMHCQQTSHVVISMRKTRLCFGHHVVNIKIPYERLFKGWSINTPRV